ncbi:MAG TPA: trypsin-like peptidase domain-containing protein [Tepidisphaeraceae bacterium]|nr:trypsin-like peptidase domain-containing protein [Tepidisphaeraceae bacterium]
MSAYGSPPSYGLPSYPPTRPPRRAGAMWVAGLLLGVGLGFLVYRWLFDVGRPEPERPVTPAGQLAGDERATVELFEKVSPSVVYITTLQQRVNLWTRNVSEIPAGTGSGFVWDEAGHVVTNFHVIQGSSSARVTLNDHSTYEATLVGVAPNFDLAVLKVNAPASKLHKIPFVGASSGLKVGQKVFAIGNPFGLDQTLTTGIVSALGRTIQGVSGQPIEEAIQTDAAINPGNSGGPLLDSSGRLIGVNTAIYSPSGASAGIGFAVPADTVNRVVPQLIKDGKLAKPEFGAVFDERFSRAVTGQLGIQGALVLGVAENSPAARAGLKPTQRVRGTIIPGDVIQKIGSRAIRSPADVDAVLERLSAGEKVTMRVWREGNEVDVEVVLGK